MTEASPHAPAQSGPASLELVVQGSAPLRGDATVPGDKSISHRALLLAAVAEGSTRILGLSGALDVRRTLDCLRALDVVIDEAAPGEARVAGRGIRGLAGRPIVLDCGDSGTTMRLLAGLLSGQDRSFQLAAHASLAGRPMARVVDPLLAMGARIRATRGRPPIVGQGGSLRGMRHELVQASAQVGGALLLAGLNARGVTEVHYPSPVRDHTERLLRAMGAPIRWDAGHSRLEGPVQRLTPPGLSPGGGGTLRVPGDMSGAAFLLAGAALVPGSRVRIAGLGLNPGRRGFLDILGAMGAELEIDEAPPGWGEPVGTVELGAPEGGLRGVEVGGAMVAAAIDELPLLAVLATQATGLSRLSGAAELKVKESDRLVAMAEGLGRMGAAIEATADGWEIQGPTPLRGARLDGRGDHRVVMALAVAGLAAAGETRILGAERVADSFPGFVETMAGLGARIATAGGPEVAG